MRHLLLVLLILGCNISASFANGLSNTEKGIIQLEYLGRQVQAVENDLRLYYMAKIEDRPNVEPIDNVQQLQILSKDLDNLQLTQEIADLKPALANVINKLITNSSGILKKDTKIRDKEFGDFWKIVNDYNDKLKIKIDKYLLIPKLAKDFKIANEDEKLFTDKKDQIMFQKASSCIDEKKYQAAVDILNPLLSKYKDKPAEGSILVNIADCYIAEESTLNKDGNKEEYVISLLTNFVNRKQYSPHINRIYLQWRTLEQSFRHGASNFSEIPNDQYNKVLWDLVETIEKHMEQNPNDAWAKYQILLLMDTPMVERWGRGYQNGNTMALDYALLNGILKN